MKTRKVKILKGYNQDFRDEVVKSILIDQMPIKQACRVFHLSRDTVRLWVRREQGLVPKAVIQPTTEEIKEKAIQDIINGKSSKKEVANRLGKSLTTIYYWLGEYEKKQMSMELEVYRKMHNSQEQEG